MDTKADQLRDILLRAGGGGTFVERQAERRGSIRSDEQVLAELGAVVAEMRERYGVASGLDDAALALVVRRFYAGDDDATLAGALGVDAETIRRARLDLHLFREAETEPEFDLVAFNRLDRRGLADGAVAAALGVDEGTVRRHREALPALRESRRTGHRYAAEFEEILSEAGLPVLLRTNPLSDYRSATDEGEAAGAATA